MTGITPYRSGLIGRDPISRMLLGDRDLGELASDMFGGGFLGQSADFKLDVEDGDKGYVVRAELPGISKDDIDVEFLDGHLSIEVDHKESDEVKERNYLHKETREWSAKRTLFLADATGQDITAKLEDGILTISVPKEPEEESPVTKVEIG